MVSSFKILCYCILIFWPICAKSGPDSALVVTKPNTDYYFYIEQIKQNTENIKKLDEKLDQLKEEKITQLYWVVGLIAGFLVLTYMGFLDKRLKKE